MNKAPHHTNPRVLRDLPIPTFGEGDRLPEEAAGESEPMIAVCLDERMAAYLVYAICRDLRSWPRTRPCVLTPDDVRAFAYFLLENLPERCRKPALAVPGPGFGTPVL